MLLYFCLLCLVAANNVTRLDKVYVGLESAFFPLGDIVSFFESLVFGDARSTHSYILLQLQDMKKSTATSRTYFEHVYRVELLNENSVLTCKVSKLDSLIPGAVYVGNVVNSTNALQEFVTRGKQWLTTHQSYNPITCNCRTLVDWILCGDNNSYMEWTTKLKPLKREDGTYSILDSIHAWKKTQ